MLKSSVGDIDVDVFEGVSESEDVSAVVYRDVYSAS